MRSPGLMVTQMLMFVFAGVGGLAVVAGRRGDAGRGVLAGGGRLSGAGLAARGR